MEKEMIESLLKEMLPGETVLLVGPRYSLPLSRGTFFLLKGMKRRYILCFHDQGHLPFPFEPLVSRAFRGEEVALYPFHWDTYEALGSFFPHLRPVPGEKRPSFGCGDRLGLVSCAHLEALERFPVFPVIAQQSPRELEKTHRTFRDVLLGAVWGVLESGYRSPFGADADHIKGEEHLKEARACGFSMYTLDLSDEVDRTVFGWEAKALQERYETLKTEEREVFLRYRGREWRLSSGVTISFSEERLLTLVLAYLPAVKKVEYFHALLEEGGFPFDLEVSLDEGEVETSPEAHFFVAEELHRRGVDFQSIAPRFPGSFEKAIDYVGEKETLASALRAHALITGNIGGYRLSLHSGSDKFSIYPLFFRETKGVFHVKTSGTSWLASLSTVAEVHPEFFRTVYAIAYETLEENLKAYALSLERNDVPPHLQGIPDSELSRFCFSHPKIRQLLHIAYGAILDRVGEELYGILFKAEKKHFAKVRENIERHLHTLFSKE